MPKAFKQKRNGSAAQSTPYAKTKAANNMFKMNTDLGQHVLKNPGVAQAIVDKADLKQSDVSVPLYTLLGIHSLSSVFGGGLGRGGGVTEQPTSGADQAPWKRILVDQFLRLSLKSALELVT